jgi:hypothetical protein
MGAIGKKKRHNMTNIIKRAALHLAREGITVIHEGKGCNSTYRVRDEDQG